MAWWSLAAATILLAACARAPRAPEVERADCPVRLAASGVRFEPWQVPAGSACRVESPVLVRATRLHIDPPLPTSCAMALAWERFEPEILDLARAELGAAPRRILHMGSHACRPMSGNAGRASLHATARALDLSGFELADGSRISVRQHWRDPGPRGRFLRALAAAACARFPMVLTPESDRYHQDHLHLDLGPFRGCGA